MFFIHESICLSPQHTFGDVDLNQLELSENNRLMVKEPTYQGIPIAVLRRMGKAVRLGVGAGLTLIGGGLKLDGIVIGTGNGGTEDCIKFLNQIEEYEEGRLTPTFFVQSSVNAVATQLAFLTNNKGYNTTHVHRGLAFETALLDVDMLLRENPSHAYLLGGVDEVSDFNYNLEDFGGWYKKEATSNGHIYKTDSAGSIAGEGSAMFVVNTVAESAVAKFVAIETFHTHNETEVVDRLQQFLSKHGMDKNEIDLLVSGENGDNRQMKYYAEVENYLNGKSGIARFKHYTGEYQTATATALWLSCQFLKSQEIAPHFIKSTGKVQGFKRILIYNTYKGIQHSFMLIEGC